MNNLTTNQYADHFMHEARQDAGMGRALEFKKGDYLVDGRVIPLGTTYIVYCKEWIKQWVKFGVGCILDRKVYHVSRHEMAPDRQELDDTDQTKWRTGNDGKPWDPWSLQYLLPFVDQASSEVLVFRTHTWGGKRAVGNLIVDWSNKVRYGGEQNPIIKIGVFQEQMRKFGKVARPEFQVIGWDQEGEPVAMPSISDDISDSIPF